ncbi:MAG: hypothetical protein ACYSTS_00965 [Planctomycetota bacterium]|jgi:hypothetical protein
MMTENEIGKVVVGAAVAVHKELGLLNFVAGLMMDSGEITSEFHGVGGITIIIDGELK